MRDDELANLLKADHISAQRAIANDDFVEMVLRRIAKKRNNRRGLILNAAALAGAAIAASQIPTLASQSPTSITDGRLLIGSLAIAGTAAAFGWAMSR